MKKSLSITAWEDSWFAPTTHFVPSAQWDNCRALYRLGRDDEADFLQQGQSVKGLNRAKSLSVTS